MVEKQNKVRKLKIYSKCLHHSEGVVIVPEIRLCGNWLSKLGFTQGNYVVLTVETNKIIITPKM